MIEKLFGRKNSLKTENKSDHWHQYHETTKDRPPRESLIEALSLVPERNVALDLGAGALTDSRYLLQSDFKKVVAVDAEPSFAERSKEINDDRLEIVVTRFEDFDFEPNNFDLINAQFSLPFTHPSEFNEVFNKLKGSLKESGIFVGQLFGDRDEWRTSSNLSFHTLDQVKELFQGLEVITLREEEADGPIAAGTHKHWHVFHVLARK